jgi:hypothetical protein
MLHKCIKLNKTIWCLLWNIHEMLQYFLAIFNKLCFLEFIDVTYLILKCKKVTLVLLRKHTRDVARSFWSLLQFSISPNFFDIEYILSKCDRLVWLLLWNHMPYVVRFLCPCCRFCASSDFQWCLYVF